MSGLTVTSFSNIQPERWLDPATWGPWKLTNRKLVYGSTRNPRYVVHLAGDWTSARVLDVVTQVARKRFATDRVLAGLVRALVQILDAQSRLCPSGVDVGPVNLDDDDA